MDAGTADFDVSSPWRDLPADVARARVLSLERSAAFCDLSPATLERLIAANQGPRVVRLSARRRGCRMGDLIDWLDARVSA
jgi:predicted DNA-binding transcriptional regulator AlpA